jgi:hypothetical protein
MTRLLILLAVLGAAAPAAAQDWFGLSAARDADRLAAEQAARQRDIVVANELARLEAQAQTSQGLSDLAAMRVRPAVPTVPFDPKAPPPKIDTRQLAQIPDKTLADSNARVRAAANNRR